MFVGNRRRVVGRKDAQWDEEANGRRDTAAEKNRFHPSEFLSNKNQTSNLKRKHWNIVKKDQHDYDGSPKAVSVPLEAKSPLVSRKNVGGWLTTRGGEPALDFRSGAKSARAPTTDTRTIFRSCGLSVQVHL
jgi:hypothetical protein